MTRASLQRVILERYNEQFPRADEIKIGNDLQ